MKCSSPDHTNQPTLKGLTGCLDARNQVMCDWTATGLLLWECPAGQWGVSSGEQAASFTNYVLVTVWHNVTWPIYWLNLELRMP